MPRQLSHHGPMNTTQAVEIHKGLEGVVADSTALSLVDGEGGHLYYRGYPVEALAEKRFVEVAWLLLFGELPNGAELDAFEDSDGDTAGYYAAAHSGAAAQ